MAEELQQRGEGMIGRTLRDKWRVDALLGEGGMATVYAATHRNGMRGAIKLLHPHLTKDAELRARLVREGYVANKVKHPGVVRILDDDVTEEGLAFIVMELLDGEPWKRRWLNAGKALPVPAMLDVAAKVLDILRAAHAAGVLHRDVKPDNVFLTTADEVKLLDFGIARLREGNVEHTQTGAMLGTPAFMSPEQTMAYWDKVDARSDLYSLGASMWLVATGQLIHVCDTMPELLIATATQPAPPFAEVFPDATPELAEAIDRAVAFDAADRWQTAEEMLAAVERAKESLTRPQSARVRAPAELTTTAASRRAVTPKRGRDGSGPRIEPSPETRRGRAGFRSGLLAGGGAAAAIAAGFGIYLTTTRASAPADAALARSVDTSAALVATTPPLAALPTLSASGAPSGAETPSSSTRGLADRSSPSAASSAHSQGKKAGTSRDAPSARPFNDGEAQSVLAEAARSASMGCSQYVSQMTSVGVSGVFLATGMFSNVEVSQGEAYPAAAGCVRMTMTRAYVTPFDGPPHPGGIGVTLVPP